MLCVFVWDTKLCFPYVFPTVNPLIVGPPSLHWLSTVWWCSNHSVVVPLSSIFVFFLSHAFSTVATQSSSHSTHASLLPVLILYGGWHRLIRLAPLLPLLRPMGLPSGTSYQVGPLGLISFFLSFRAFIALCFYLTPLLPHFGPMGLPVAFPTGLL